VSRARTLLVTILPSAIAGGFLFASAFGHAETSPDHARGSWSAAPDASGAVLLAQADPRPPRYPGIPPVPPAPPARSWDSRHHHGRGVSVSIHGGKVEIDGINELIENSLEGALTALDNLPDVSTETRVRLKDRIKAVRDRIKSRLSHLKSTDVDKLGREMERMGDEIEHEMEGLDQELSQLGDKIGREFARKFGKDFSKDFGKDWAKSFGPGSGVTSVPSVPHGRDSDDEDDDEDDDDKDSVTLPPGVDSADADSADLAPAIAQLKGKLALDDAQRTQLARLRADSDTQVARAKHDLEQMSDRLHDALRDDSANEAEIARQIDSISEREATIRKARILTWIKARNVLRADQRRQVEDAVRRGH